MVRGDGGSSSYGRKGHHHHSLVGGGGALSGESRDLSMLPPAMMVRGCKDVKMIGCDDGRVRW